MTSFDIDDEPLPSAICEGCSGHDCVVRFRRCDTDEVRGLTVHVTKILRRCTSCGIVFENSQDADWRPDAYRLYRETRGWVTPEEITAWRRERDLDLGEMAYLLRWNKLTLERYEHGSLQSEAHNTQLACLVGMQASSGT